MKTTFAVLVLSSITIYASYEMCGAWWTMLGLVTIPVILRLLWVRLQPWTKSL
jgi:hypothetical protein